MNRLLAISGLMVALLVAVGVATAVAVKTAVPLQDTTTVVFYDGSLGTLPEAQHLFYGELLAGPTQTLVPGGVIFNTLVLPLGQAHMAGFAADPALLPQLARTPGYTVTLALQVLNEIHSSPDRAGFSLLVLSDDANGTETVKGLELAFWQNEVWAQNDATQGGYFTHGEGVSFNTTTAVVRYDLFIITDTYRLSADGQPILSGPIRDYTGFEGTLDPYETPNVVAFGDNTTSAGARVQFNYVAVTLPVPSVIEPDFLLFLPVAIRP